MKLLNGRLNNGILILIGFLVLFFTFLIFPGCNREIFWDFKWKFATAYIDFGEPVGVKIIKVKSWRDFEKSDTVQIVDKDGNVYLTHYNKVVLVGDNQ